MRRLGINIHYANLSTYVDAFYNHGMNFSFPWLLAHNHSFFGNFDNLNILMTVLKFRRGFNCKIGSKNRKRYFSDINKILSEFGERVFCCEDFQPTVHINKTRQFQDVRTVVHTVNETEGCFLIEDGVCDMLDFKEVERKVHKPKPFYTMDDFPGIESNSFFRMLNKMADSSLITPQFILGEERYKKLKELDDNYSSEIERLVKIKDDLNVIYGLRGCNSRGTFLLEDLKTPPVDCEKRDHIETVLRYLISYIENYDYVTQPLVDVRSVAFRWVKNGAKKRE